MLIDQNIPDTALGALCPNNGCLIYLSKQECIYG